MVMTTLQAPCLQVVGEGEISSLPNTIDKDIFVVKFIPLIPIATKMKLLNFFFTMYDMNFFAAFSFRW